MYTNMHLDTQRQLSSVGVFASLGWSYFCLWAAMAVIAITGRILFPIALARSSILICALL